MSHPAWVCGLKHYMADWQQWLLCHTLRGCVDWNMMVLSHILKRVKSHPAWVCGLKLSVAFTITLSPFCHTLRGCVDWNRAWYSPVNEWGSHTLRGCVDWNRRIWIKLKKKVVTPCVGVWIETILLHANTTEAGSHPAWVCGLKLCFR